MQKSNSFRYVSCISLWVITKCGWELKTIFRKIFKDEFYASFSNVSTNAYTTKVEAIELLASQLTSPVKYKTISCCTYDKVDMFIEFEMELF